ncbi:MAG TPA: zinc ribbon domain-containing protein [Pyrinomonadaceae bacterium]|nr:zinc ribbon domain-containing protein [Pyrinomonadaceae bacterium]
MYCPTCGSEERQPSQYCRACGTDLRGVRNSLERPDVITASAISAREQISQAMAEKIRQMEPQDLKRVAEDVLPQLEKFLESPEQKRLRRARAGVITAAAGLGSALLLVLMSMQSHDLLQFAPLGVITFLIGIGLIINGLALTVPKKKLADRSDDAQAQKELEAGAGGFQQPLPSVTRNSTTNELLSVQPSVTEHTTHQLKPQKSE